MSTTRVHDQIVDLISRSHSTTESIEVRIQSLQQATELLLFHSSANERVDEFLETLLSLNVSREAPFRRFCAYFVDVLCFTRSRFACSCLDVLVTLLQDSDKQVQIFALRAARTVYKRALYWISVQQREALYVEAARESVETLDFVLARVVHLITSSSREVFCEAIRCAQAVVLCQSHSSFPPKSQAQLEAAGSSCLEDLKLLDSPTTALDESKLKGQADRLFTALCALLVKKRDESAPEMEVVALIKAVGSVGHQRPAYAATATVAFTQLTETVGKEHHRTRACLVAELKRLLSSRHCVMWQPRIIPVLASLGVSDSNIVLRAEIERLKDQAETEQGLEAPPKRRRLDEETEGERLMALSEAADATKVPDENHAEAVHAVRAQTPADLAKIALNLLGKLPKTFDDPMTALLRVTRSATTNSSATVSGSIGFEARVRAAKAMNIRISDFLPDMESTNISRLDEDQSEEEAGSVGEEDRQAIFSVSKDYLVDVAELAGKVGSARADLFMKVLFGLKGTSREKKLELLRSVFRNLNFESVKALFMTVYKSELIETGVEITTEDLGAILLEQGPSIADLKSLIAALPIIPSCMLDYIDMHAGSQEAATRRSALTTLAGLVTSRPGLAVDCLTRLLGHCTSQSEEARTDALKLVLAKVYRPQSSLLKTQWPYNESETSSIVDTVQGSVSLLDYICSEKLEELARGMLEHACSGEWNKAWIMLALCSKKPKLIHCVLSTIIETLAGEASIPGEVMQAFSQSLLSLPGEAIDPELELIVKHYKSVRAAAKKKHRNEFLLPILSALSSTDRGLTGNLADAALSLRK